MKNSKHLAVILMLVLAFCLLPVVAQSRTLKVWLPPFGAGDTLDREFWENAFVDFEKAHDCTVRIEIIPWSNYEDKYLTAFAGGTGPDVGYMSMEMIGSFIEMGNVAAMDDYITDGDRANYLYLDKGIINGQQYAFPFIVGNPRVLFCNMDLLNVAGVQKAPKTWDELVSVAKKIKESGSDSYVFLQPWGDPRNMVTMFHPFFYQAGGRLWDEEQKKFAIDTPEMLQTVQFLHDLRHTHGVMDEIATSLKAGDVKTMFLDGRVAMIVEAATFASQVTAAGLNWGHSVLAGAKQATFIAVDSLVLCAAASDKNLAYAAIQYMSSGEVMSAYHNEVAMFAPIGKDEEYGDNPAFQYIYTDDDIELMAFPAVPGMYKVDDALRQNLQLMQLGRLSPEEVVADTEAYVSFEFDD